jgi:hypothetical protein
MKNFSIPILVLTIAGLVIGYLIFGKIAGEYLSLNAIFGGSSGALESFGRKVAGLDSIRQNILLSGLGGAIVGLVYHFVKKGGK